MARSSPGTIPLDTGSNGIQVTVTDPAGNKQVVLRTVLYDPNALLIAITHPAHDIQLHTTTYLLKGTVSGSPSTVNLTFDGQTFTPAVTAGAFQQAVTIPAEGSYQAVASIGTPPSYAVRNIIYTAFPGDVDASGSITTLPDILTASQAAFGQITLTPTQTLRLDCAPLGADGKPNPNGVVDIADVILLLRKVVGLVNW